MTILAFIVAAWLFLWGLYGIVGSRHIVHLCICLTIVQAATYLVLAGIGYRAHSLPPVFSGIKAATPVVDPIVQALMLTDIVVEATVVALVLALAIQLHKKTGHIDPNEVHELEG